MSQSRFKKRAVAKKAARKAANKRIHAFAGGIAGTLRGSHPSNNWFTPAWLLEWIRFLFGGAIGLDPCTVAANPTGANAFFTLLTDGLGQAWCPHECAFVNPPYSDIERWIDKAISEARLGMRVILLVPVRTDTAYHHRLVTAATDILLLRGRVRFRPEDGDAAGSPAFCSMLVGLGVSLKPVAHLGTIVVPDLPV